jgi:hypothetical protein
VSGVWRNAIGEWGWVIRRLSNSLAVSATVLCAAVIASLAARAVVWQWRYRQAIGQADRVLYASRGDPAADPNSSMFMARGIRAGMTVDEVTVLLGGDSETPWADPDPTTALQPMGRKYRFDHNGLFDNPFGGTSAARVSEEINVYFNSDGKAARITYVRHGSGRWGLLNRNVDLARLPVRRDE